MAMDKRTETIFVTGKKYHHSPNQKHRFSPVYNYNKMET